MSKKLGQYFTTNISLKKKVLEFIQNEPDNILEPCIGQGDLVNYVSENLEVSFDMYEIDSSIKLLDGINKNKVIYTDFLQEDITKQYTTIIGNPPYVKTKSKNLYIEFTEKCYNLLTHKGELIFIIPSDFFKLTSSSTLLNEMMENGIFTHIYHPNDEHLFESASIDVIIFRYCKDDSLEKKVLYNTKSLYVINNNGTITFTENTATNRILQDYFDIYVGMVSAKESVYKNALGNIKILTGEDKLEKYIYIEKFPSGDDEIDNYLLEHKEELLERKIRKFNKNNWFEWGAPRNVKAIQNNLNKKCIYIYNLTRKDKIAFVNKVQYFGGNLIMLIPKEEIDLTDIVNYMNDDKFKSNYIFSGRFKIGHRQLCNANF